MQKASLLASGLEPGPAGVSDNSRVRARAGAGATCFLLPADSHPDVPGTELIRAGHSEGPRGSSVQDPSGRTQVPAGREAPPPPRTAQPTGAPSLPLHGLLPSRTAHHARAPPARRPYSLLWLTLPLPRKPGSHMLQKTPRRMEALDSGFKVQLRSKPLPDLPGHVR